MNSLVATDLLITLPGRRTRAVLLAHTERRLDRATATGTPGPIAITDIVDGQALVRLHTHYPSSGRSLRKQLRILHGALSHTCWPGVPLEQRSTPFVCDYVPFRYVIAQR